MIKSSKLFAPTATLLLFLLLQFNATAQRPTATASPQPVVVNAPTYTPSPASPQVRSSCSSQAVSACVSKVDARFVAMLANFGFTGLSQEEAASAKSHGLSNRRLAELKSTNVPIDDLDEVKKAVIHGVDARLISGLQAIGYRELVLQDFITARVHGISAEWAASFREVGFKNIPFKTLVDLRVHGVSVDFIKDRLAEGQPLAYYIGIKIHGL